MLAKDLQEAGIEVFNGTAGRKQGSDLLSNGDSNGRGGILTQLQQRRLIPCLYEPEQPGY